MQKHIDAFFKALADSLQIDVNTLSLIATVQSGGPTVSPGSDPTGEVQSKAEVRFGQGADKLPTLWYDSIGTNHCDFRIVQTLEKGNVKVPKFLYGWQHAPFFGNCKIAMNRWVRFGQGLEGNKDLKKAGLKLRVAFAKNKASVATLVVSTGASSQGYTAEVHDAFKEGFSNSLHKILVLDLNKFKEA